jgi:hypothetical protein
LVAEWCVEEKLELFDTIEEFDPYPGELEEESEMGDDDSINRAKLTSTLERVINYEHLDLALARTVVRTARRQSVPDLAEHLLEHIEFFAPAINDVALYLREVTDADLALQLRPAVEDLLLKPALDNQLVRFWIEWYLAQVLAFMESYKIYQFVFKGRNIENQALAAITTRNIAWIRNHKGIVFNLGGWARRAVLNASRVLPGDEREHWLRMFINNSPVLLDRWVAKWILEIA